MEEDHDQDQEQNQEKNQEQNQEQNPDQNQEDQNQIGLKRRMDEITEIVKEIRQQQTQMQSELHRQLTFYEDERQKYHEECQKLKEQRERLLRQRNSPSKAHSITGLQMSSRAIAHGPAGGHRPIRSFHYLPEKLKNKIRQVVVRQRDALAATIRRQRQDVIADQATRAMNTLSLSDQSNRPSTSRSNPTSPLKLPKGSASTTIFNQETEEITRRNRLQHQLSSVLHTQTCENSNSCGIQNCAATNKILEHIRTCTLIRRCPVHLCSITREALHHYKNCKTDGCQICQPAKQESSTTQEHLLKFMESSYKGLDEEASIEKPSLPRCVFPPVDPPSTSVSLITQTSFTPVILPRIDFTSFSSAFLFTSSTYTSSPPSFTSVVVPTPNNPTAIPLPFLTTLPSTSSYTGHVETPEKESPTEVKMENLEEEAPMENSDENSD